MKRVISSMIGVVLTLALSTASALDDRNAAESPFGVYRVQPSFDGSITTSQYVTMRDGVCLAVSVRRPAKNGAAVEGKFPVIWQHSLGIAAVGNEAGPLGQDVANRGYRNVPSLVRYGYVVVQVARRGNGPSFGIR